MHISDSNYVDQNAFDLATARLFPWWGHGCFWHYPESQTNKSQACVILNTLFCSTVHKHLHCLALSTGPAYFKWRKGVVRLSSSAAVSVIFCFFFFSMWRGAGGVGEVLELAGIQLVSTSCSVQWAGTACLSIPALAPSGFLSLLLLFLLGRPLGLCFSLTLGLSLGLRLFLRRSGGRCCWGRGRGTRRHYDLVLALSVSDDRAQEQCDDSHKVEVPLRAQELVQVHLRNHLLQLRDDHSQMGRGWRTKTYLINFSFL